jgi:fused signal recognition particle receptor
LTEREAPNKVRAVLDQLVVHPGAPALALAPLDRLVVALPQGLTALQIALAVALLVVLALFLAFLATRAVRKRAPPALPPETRKERLEEPPALVPVEPREVVLPKERLQREERARAELTEAQDALAAAEAALQAEPGEAGKLARRAEATRLARDVADAQRKLDYETRKTAEAEEKLRRQAEAAARASAEATAAAALEHAAEAQRAAEAAARERAAQAEAGRTLAEGLAKTRSGFMARLNDLLGTGKALDEAALAELEEILFSADVGVRTATDLLSRIRERLKRKELADLSRVKSALREEIERILALGGEPGSALQAGHGGLPDLQNGAAQPLVVMVVGVNGTGKTTTIGKLAALLVGRGKRVLLGAGDTFRAAAGEQLDVWADRAKVPMVRGKDGSDPGAVLFDAVARGKAEAVDVVLCDTAGRLHTKTGLMDELRRLKRTLAKAHAGAPHEVLLVVDATTGQNAIAQARQFHEALGVTGFVLTKLDGTAKGGVIIGICDELKIPVRYVGVGETVADLKAFDPHEFVQALFD